MHLYVVIAILTVKAFRKCSLCIICDILDASKASERRLKVRRLLEYNRPFRLQCTGLPTPLYLLRRLLNVFKMPLRRLLEASDT